VGRRCVGMYSNIWLQGEIHVREWCCEVVASCEVQQVARCSFLLPRNPIKPCMCVCLRQCESSVHCLMLFTLFAFDYFTYVFVMLLTWLLQVLREQYGVRCMLGLTATATMTTAVSVARHLGIVNNAAATIRGAPIPANLKLSVSSDGNREQVTGLDYILCHILFRSLGSVL